MSNSDNGGPAFPYPIQEYGALAKTGMTLRDYFAAAALQGIMASPNSTGGGEPIEKVMAAYADVAYKAADAMLAERAK